MAKPSRPTSASMADEHVGRSRGRDQLAVADRGERLDAEEHAVLEARERRGGGAGDRAGPGQPVERREQQVGGEVARGHQREQARDRQREQRVIGVVGVERAQVVAADVERAVAIEQPDAAPLGELAAEPEVLVQPFLSGVNRAQLGSSIITLAPGPFDVRRRTALRLQDPGTGSSARRFCGGL